MTEKEKKKAKTPIRLDYVGSGKFLAGVSIALTLEEFLEMPKKQQKHLTEVLGLYEVIYD